MGSGAAEIFGTSGGVAEAVVRCCLPDKSKNALRMLEHSGLRGTEPIRFVTIPIGERDVRIALVHGLANAAKLLDQIERGEVQYDFVEVMACPGGCVGGGGQPIHDGEELAFTRGRKLYALDAKAKLRYSHENPDIREIYSDFFGKPMSHKAHMLLHTEHWKNN